MTPQNGSHRESVSDYWGLTHLEESIVEVEYLRAHEILGTDSTENNNVAPNTLVTENTNTAVGIETSKGLGNLR